MTTYVIELLLWIFGLYLVGCALGALAFSIWQRRSGRPRKG